MQINIDKKTGIFTGVIAVLIAVIIVMGFSSRDEGHFFGMHHSGMMDSQDEASIGQLTGADIMFLQMMIPHHQQAVDISNLALTKSKDAELLALATKIRDGQADEIVQMKSWLSLAGSNIVMDHSMGHDMGGMLDDAALSELQKASASTFDRLWLQGMIGHHDGAIHMTQMIEDASNPVIKKFGQDIVATQSAQIDQMQIMLQRITK